MSGALASKNFLGSNLRLLNLDDTEKIPVGIL